MSEQASAGDKVRVKTRHRSTEAEGGFTYEIDPLEYEALELPEGAVLEVVSVPEVSDG